MNTTADSPSPSFFQEPWFKRALPFAIYMLFILLHDLLARSLPSGYLSGHLLTVTYPLRIIAVIAALAVYWKSYDEIDRSGLTPWGVSYALVIGTIVFVLWINMDWPWATMGDMEAYNPRTLPETGFYAFVAVRLFGASVVVPIFEEIFWRSLVLRYIINPDFTSVKVGTFTWASFVISSILFGLEHHLWLAGMVAGMLYNFLLYRTRSLTLCIIAHGITNFLLGVYVLWTGYWQFW